MGQIKVRCWLDFTCVYKESVKLMEFSKIILVFSSFINVFVIVFTCIMVWKTNDTSPLIYLIPSVAAEVATGTGFYYNKAKVENRIKLMKKYKVTPTQEAFSDEGGYING